MLGSSSSDVRSSGESMPARLSRSAPSGCPFSTWAIVARRRSSWRLCSSSRASVSAGSQIFGFSETPAVSVPVLLEVAHERGTEVTVGLLVGVGGHVLAEQLDRLLPNPHRGAVCGGVDQARAGQGGDASVDSLV